MLCFLYFHCKELREEVRHFGADCDCERNVPFVIEVMRLLISGHYFYAEAKAKATKRCFERSARRASAVLA